MRMDTRPNSLASIVVAGLVLFGLAGVARADEQAKPEAMKEAERKQIEKYGDGFVVAINADTAEARTKAVMEVYSQDALKSVGEERLTERIARLRKDYGILEYYHSDLVESRINEKVSYLLHVYAKKKAAKNWHDFQFRLEPTPPHKIKELVFIAEVSEPISLPNGAIDDRTTQDWLNKYIDKLIGDNDLSGSVLIAKGDQPFFERTYGFADAKRTAKITENTRFNLGSGNKMFTAIAIAQLVEQGKLSYSDPISKYFPDFPDAAFAKKATVHHLLSHTSGVKEYWTAEYEKSWSKIDDVKKMLPWVYKVGTEFEPGKQYRYSNSNFILAGLIVEQVSGTDYYSYVRKHITDPLGLTLTDFYLRDGSVPDLAQPLTRGAKGWKIADQGTRGTSAGGGYSTSRDILKYSRGLVQHKLIAKETLALLTTSKTRELKADTDYGYGFILSNEGIVRSFGHGGTAKGVNFEFRYFPEADLTLVAFCNQDNGAYDDLRRNIVKLITGVR